MNIQELQTKLEGYEHGLSEAETYTKYGIVVPVLERKGESFIVFEKRAHTLRRQPGEICFPGGKHEPTDQSLWETARREAGEELCIPTSAIHLITPLDYMVTHSRMLIYPFAGILDFYEPFQPNVHEVEEILLLSLHRLLKLRPSIHDVELNMKPSAEFPLHLIPGGAAYRWRGGRIKQLFYECDGHVIWGLTARILHQFLRILQK